MLVELTENSCYLPLPERVIESIVDGLRGDSQPSDGVAIDLQHHARSSRLQIAGHILELRQGGKPGQYNGGPFEQLRDIRVLQSILILGLADSGPDLHILAGLPKQGDSRDPRGRPAKPIDDIGGRRRALAKRFEVDHQAAGIHRRICSDYEDYFGIRDIAHLIRVVGRTMDWRRLVDRFGRFWPVLLAHVILYDFIYPADRGRVPDWVRGELFDRAREEMVDPTVVEDRVCFGPTVSRAQYLPDVEGLGYRDGRLKPYGLLEQADVEHENERMRKELGL